MFGAKLQVIRQFSLRGQWILLLLALLGVDVLHAQAQSKDERFLSLLAELREASYADKANIAERLSQTGHSSARAVLTAFLDDRLYFRNDDQKVFIAKAADTDPIELIEVLATLTSALPA